MIQTLSFKIPKNGKIFVNENETVVQGSALAEGREEGEKRHFSIAKIFKTAPSQVFKFLVKKLGDRVKKGEVLAKKESLLGRMILRSPFDGRLAEISEILGEITLVREENKAVVKSPVSGRIKEIGNEEIKIEFKGVVFEGKRGGGEKVFGEIENLPTDVGVLALSNRIAQKILASQSFSPEVLAKAWALEAAAVGTDFLAKKDPPLPFLLIGKRELEALKNYQGKKAVLEPKEKRLIVLLE